MYSTYAIPPGVVAGDKESPQFGAVAQLTPRLTVGKVLPVSSHVCSEKEKKSNKVPPTTTKPPHFPLAPPPTHRCRILLTHGDRRTQSQQMITRWVGVGVAVRVGVGVVAGVGVCSDDTEAKRSMYV